MGAAPYKVALSFETAPTGVHTADPGHFEEKKAPAHFLLSEAALTMHWESSGANTPKA